MFCSYDLAHAILTGEEASKGQNDHKYPEVYHGSEVEDQEEK